VRDDLEFDPGQNALEGPNTGFGQEARNIRFVPKADILRCGKNVAIRSPRLASPLRHYP
jgi:hypothetical protein